jgi:hypothetical protein
MVMKKTNVVLLLATLAAPVAAGAAEVRSVVVETNTLTAAPGANLVTRSGAGPHSSIGTWYSVLPPGGRLVAWRLGVDPSLGGSSRVRVHCALESGPAVSSPAGSPPEAFTPFYDFAWSPGLPLRDSPGTLPAPLLFEENVTTVWLSVHVRNASPDTVKARCVAHLFFLVGE